jgi:UDP-glucose 4-epimerase
MAAMFIGLDKVKNQIEIFHFGPEDQIDVKAISQIVVEEMGFKDVKLAFTESVDGGRGWTGDVKNMLLNISKLKSLGWNPKSNSEQAVRKAAKHLIIELE